LSDTSDVQTDQIIVSIDMLQLVSTNYRKNELDNSFASLMTSVIV